MTFISRAVSVALIAGATAIPLQSASAWGGPWGGNMFGMDFGQSYGYGNRWYPSGGWGYPGYGGYGMYQGYGYGHGMMPYGYGYPPAVVAPATPSAEKKY